MENYNFDALVSILVNQLNLVAEQTSEKYPEYHIIWSKEDLIEDTYSKFVVTKLGSSKFDKAIGVYKIFQSFAQFESLVSFVNNFCISTTIANCKEEQKRSNDSGEALSEEYRKILLDNTIVELGRVITISDSSTVNSMIALVHKLVHDFENREANSRLDRLDKLEYMSICIGEISTFLEAIKVKLGILNVDKYR